MLSDKANDLVEKATKQVPEFRDNPDLDKLLKQIITQSMTQGFRYGVNSVKQTTELLLNLTKSDEDGI
jgi:hypothetical protein